MEHDGQPVQNVAAEAAPPPAVAHPVEALELAGFEDLPNERKTGYNFLYAFSLAYWTALIAEFGTHVPLLETGYSVHEVVVRAVRSLFWYNGDLRPYYEKSKLKSGYDGTQPVDGLVQQKLKKREQGFKSRIINNIWLNASKLNGNVKPANWAACLALLPRFRFFYALKQFTAQGLATGRVQIAIGHVILEEFYQCFRATLVATNISKKATVLCTSLEEKWVAIQSNLGVFAMESTVLRDILWCKSSKTVNTKERSPAWNALAQQGCNLPFSVRTQYAAHMGPAHLLKKCTTIWGRIQSGRQNGGNFSKMQDKGERVRKLLKSKLVSSYQRSLCDLLFVKKALPAEEHKAVLSQLCDSMKFIKPRRDARFHTPLAYRKPGSFPSGPEEHATEVETSNVLSLHFAELGWMCALGFYCESAATLQTYFPNLGPRSKWVRRALSTKSDGVIFAIFNKPSMIGTGIPTPMKGSPSFSASAGAEEMAMPTTSGIREKVDIIGNSTGALSTRRISELLQVEMDINKNAKWEGTPLATMVWQQAEYGPRVGGNPAPVLTPAGFKRGKPVETQVAELKNIRTGQKEQFEKQRRELSFAGSFLGY